MEGLIVLLFKGGLVPRVVFAEPRNLIPVSPLATCGAPAALGGVMALNQAFATYGGPSLAILRPGIPVIYLAMASLSACPALAFRCSTG